MQSGHYKRDNSGQVPTTVNKTGIIFKIIYFGTMLPLYGILNLLSIQSTIMSLQSRSSAVQSAGLGVGLIVVVPQGLSVDSEKIELKGMSN